MRLTNEKDMLARTLWGEARGEGVIGMGMVADVILNRVLSPRFHNTLLGVIFDPKDFSTWNIGDPNRYKAMAVTDADPQFKAALKVADEAVRLLHGEDVFTIWRGLAKGATHYAAKNITPYWADPKVSPDIQTVAYSTGHKFYKGVA